MRQASTGAVEDPTPAEVEGSVNKGRPVSPHVTIYKMPMTAVSSIMNRVTGMTLVGGFAAASVAYLPMQGDMADLVHAFKDAAPALVPLAKFSVAFPLVYHYAASARHIYWDFTGKGIATATADSQSQALIGASTVASVLLAAM